MTTLLPETETDLNIENLEEFDFDITPQCDNDECENDATHMIRCVCQKGVEFSCWNCILSIKSDPLALIEFDPNKSCGHLTSLHVCEITPI